MTARSAGALDRAIVLMARIRREGRWESAQTHQSLLPYLVEETWELVDAVEGGDRDALISELGDLLLQVLFHAAIGAEREDEPFGIEDVAQALLNKLAERAPYWFDGADVSELSAKEQDRLWQEAKARARVDQPVDPGLFGGISWSQPALALGEQVVSRARRAGIDVPEELLVARVGQVAGVRFGADGTEPVSAELEYRARLRKFADQVEAGLRAPG